MSIRSIHHWFGRHPMVGDTLIALAMWIPTGAGTVGSESTPLPTALRVAWSLLYVVPLVWRRARPDIAAAGVAAGCLVQLIVQNSPNGADICVPVVIYAVSAYGSQRRAKWWLRLALAGALAAGLRWPTGDMLSHNPDRETLIINITAITLICAVTVLMAWYAGQFARERRVNLEQLRQRATDLERERDQRVELATQQERARIAREMHDVVAHSLSVIVVQADGGAYLAHHNDAGDAPDRLQASGAALDTIAETARRALGETRRLVGVLRDDSGSPAALAPSRGLDDLPSLITETRQVLPVSFTITGDPGCHPRPAEGAELACYRVVQESLTNVLKHGGPGATAQVRLTHLPGQIEILVLDDGLGAGASPDDGRGHGLVGMRERVAAWGGTLEARSRLDGGFQVHAVIPVEDPVGTSPAGPPPETSDCPSTPAASDPAQAPDHPGETP